MTYRPPNRTGYCFPREDPKLTVDGPDDADPRACGKCRGRGFLIPMGGWLPCPVCEAVEAVA